MAGERTIRIKIDGDGQGLIVTARTVEKEIDRLGKQVDHANKRFVNAAGGFAKFALKAAALSSSTNAVYALGAALVTASGALVGLPALAGAGAAAMATVSLGAAGIERAVKGVNKSLIPLQGQVSATFEEGLAPAVRDINSLLPQTSSGFQAIAREMAGTVRAATGVAVLPHNTETLNTVLARTSGLMSGVRRAAGPLTSALLDVTEVGTEGFGSIGNRIASASSQFAGFIAHARASGQLREWLDNGIGALRDMWQMLKDVGATVRGVFSGISEGAGGIGPTLQPAIKAMRQFVESTRGQKFLNQIGAALAEIGEAVGGVLASGLNAVAPLIGPMAQAFAAMATAASGILIPALTVLAPILETIGTFMSENEGLVRVLVTALGGLAVAYLSVHGAIKIVTQATTIWTAISGVASQRTAALGTSFANMGKVARIASLSMGAIGLVLSVVGTAMTLFSDNSDDAAAAQQELAAQGRSVAEAIAEQNGVINESNRNQVAKNLEAKGALELAEKVGVSTRQLVAAVLQEGDAYERVTARLKGYVAEGVNGTDEEKRRAAFALSLLGTVNAQSGAIDEGTKAIQREKSAAEESTSATERNTTSRQLNIDALREQIGLLREEAGIVLDVRAAESAYQEAVDSASEAIKRNGETLDQNTAKGRDNQAKLDDIAKSTFDLIDAEAAKGASSQRLESLMARGRREFIETARQMGLNETEASRLASALKLIPARVKTTVELRKETAQGNLAAYKRALDNIPRTITTTTYVRGANINGSGGHQFVGRATGGPVLPGRSYVVGERGPEIFRAPNSGGHIVPNHELRGGDVAVYVTIDGQQLQGRIDKTVRENNRGIRRAATAGTGGAL